MKEMPFILFCRHVVILQWGDSGVLLLLPSFCSLALLLCRGILKKIFINALDGNQVLTEMGSPHIWPQGNDSKFVSNWGKWIKGKMYYQFYQNAHYPPPPWEPLTVMSHYMHCVHVPYPLEVLRTFGNVWGCAASFRLPSNQPSTLVMSHYLLRPKDSGVKDMCPVFSL